MEKEKNKKKLGKKKIIITVLVAVFLVLFCFIQNNFLTVTFYTINNDKLPEAFDGYRIVQISDLHNATFGKDNKYLIEKIKELEPDIVVMTGDMVDSGRTNIEISIEFAEDVVGICPAYYITGNHENIIDEKQKAEFIAGMERAGVVCLDDEACDLRCGDDYIKLIGLDDASLRDNTLSDLTKKLNEDEFKILLAHEPHYFEEYCLTDVDLIFAGHAHGGQFRFPFVGGLFTMDEGFFPKYEEGTFNKNDTTMVVSRGLGNSVFPLRLFNYPEIICVDLQR